MHMVKTSVEGSKCLLRHVLPGERGVRCARDRGSPRDTGDRKGHDVAAGQPVVEVWLKIEDLLPLSASVKWTKCATVCKACYDTGGRGIGLLDIRDTNHKVLFCNHRGGRDMKIRSPLPDPTFATKHELLDCSFGIHQLAKFAGAKWHRERRYWYAPKGCNLAPLNDLAMLPLHVANKYRVAVSASSSRSSSSRICKGEGCTVDLTREPTWKTRCYSCHSAFKTNDGVSTAKKRKREAEPGASPSKSSQDSSSSNSSSRQSRTCPDCKTADLTSEPVWKKQCRACYYKSAKKRKR